MARSQIKWNYTNLNSIYSMVNNTSGVLSFTVKSEWKFSPARNLLQKLLPSKALFGSIHRYIFEIRSTGVSSCHVSMKTIPASGDIFDFDLPTTAEDDFVSALERIGDAKIEHPWFLNDRHPYQESVSLNDATTTVSFTQKKSPD
ncbi:MAG TPA: hypothetical protein VK704_00945 [Acidimicrobiales bacterium]|nr:hypothetical protein [Acidimicrobiales bacterium]